MPHAIETIALSKRFGAVTAVEDVALSVPERSVYAFLGPNGAGKTTTIRLLLGLLRPSAGEARIFGHDIRRERLEALANVGAVIETPALYDHLSGRENVDITRGVLGLKRSETDRVLELVGLTGAQRRRAGGYSLGMRQRLALARALLGAPKLLLLDEPTNGLDPDGIQEMRSFIHTLPERTGATVFLSSHLLSEVEQTATHVGLVSNGRLVLQDTLADVLRGRQPVIEFDVDDAARAVSVLASAWPEETVSLTERGVRVRLRAQGDGREGAAAINAALVGAGIGVFRIAPQAHRLEDVYMTHVGAHATGETHVPSPA